MSTTSRKLIVHVIYRLGVGGLENGLVNLINTMPANRYRHVIICLKDSTDFQSRIKHEDVEIFSLHRKEGKDWRVFFKIYRLFRQLQPDIVHTRNLAAIECQIPAYLAGVKCRVHGEHGWDVYDPDGSNKKYQWLRRILKQFIHCFIPLSHELEDYLRNRVYVSESKISRICNGVDTTKFYGVPGEKKRIDGCPFNPSDYLLIGTVGRMHGVKDQLNLVNAFLRVVKQNDQWHKSPRLILVGEGPLREESIDLLKSENAEQLAWLPGAREDIADVLRGLDIFVLPSLAEGISNTILEAMASGLPVIATNVGGNAHLIDNGTTGLIVPKQNSIALASAIETYGQDYGLRVEHATKGLQRIKDNFSLDNMVAEYISMYERVCLQQSQ